MKVKIGIVNSLSAISPCGLSPHCERHGITVDAAIMVCQHLGLKCDLHIHNSPDYGEVFENGTGIGMLGAIQQGIYDTSTPIFAVTYRRFQTLDFSDAYFYSDVVMATRAPVSKEGFNIGHVFEWSVWALTILSLISVALVLAAFGKSTKRAEISKAGWLSYTSSRISSLCTHKHCWRSVQSHSSRILVISWSLMAVVLGSAFTSKLFSNRVSNTLALPYKDFETFVQCLEEARCRLVAHSLTASYLQVLFSSESSLGRRIQASFTDQPPLVTPAGSIPRMILREEDQFLVWIASRNAFNQATQDGTLCDLYVIDAPYKEAWSFVVRKGSPLLKALNQMSVLFRENGLAQMLYSRYRVAAWCKSTDSAETSTLQLLAESEILWFYGAGMLVGVALFVVEKGAYRYYRYGR